MAGEGRQRARAAAAPEETGRAGSALREAPAREAAAGPGGVKGTGTGVRSPGGAGAGPSAAGRRLLVAAATGPADARPQHGRSGRGGVGESGGTAGCDPGAPRPAARAVSRGEAAAWPSPQASGKAPQCLQQSRALRRWLGRSPRPC